MELLNFFSQQIWSQGFAAGIIGNLLASHLYDAGKAGSNRLGERLSALRQQGGAFHNHDLQRALLFAQCQSLVAVCEICLLKDYGTQPTMSRAFLKSDDILPRGLLSHINDEEVAFIAALRGEFARYASRVEQMPEDELNALLQFQAGDVSSLWAASREASDAADVAELRQRATADAQRLLEATPVNKWLTGVVGNITQAIREQLGRPSQIAGVPDKLLRRFETDWFDLVRVAFRETLKDGRFEKAKRAFELDVLTQLGEVVPQRFDELDARLAQQDTKLDAVLTALRQLAAALNRSTSDDEQQQVFLAWLPQWQAVQTQLSRIEATTTRTDATATRIEEKVTFLVEEWKREPNVPPAPEQKIEIARMPRLLTPDLFGRDDELKLLDDAWASQQTNVISFVAWGGVGKSALVSHWLQALERDNWRGAERVFAWSFYSQGTSDKAATAEYFINAALRWFGGDALADQLQTAGQWEKGERLAQLVRQTRTLLILDGLEPVQHPPLHPDEPEGGLKEQTMQALLRELAAHQPGLCVISTRFAIADLTQFEGRSVIRHPLDQLAPPAGAQLLRRLKVNGTQAELEAATVEYGGHSLALTLLGSYLSDVYAGDVRRRHEIENLEEDRKHGRHARKVLRAYEQWLSAQGQKAMLDVLRLLGLFDRPADGAAVAALRAAPAIAGLTDSFFRKEQRKRWFGLSTATVTTDEPINESEWRNAIAALRDLRLLAEAAPHDPGTLDAHPLVREHFGQQMKDAHPDAWRAANLRLYEHLTSTTKEFPDTVEEMAPLYAAVAHGCVAGRHQQVIDDVYWRRIQRGNEFFSTRKLGAMGADLAALVGFFAAPWRQPVAGLTETYQARVLNWAGFCLRALGRLQEAAEPTQAGLQADISMKDWKNAAQAATNLSELYLTMGDLPQALELARQSVELADRSSDEFRRMSDRAMLADVLHQAGQAEEAEAAFRQAEEMQKQLQPAYPFLYSIRGFRYCDLLLGQGKHQEVKERAARTIEWGKQQQFGPLYIALDNLSLGRTWLLQARQAGASDYGQAADFLQRALDGLRQAGTMHHLPRGLLARAELRRVTGGYERAQADLDEAQRIAERGGMRLHLSDCHLERARLWLAQGAVEQARAAWRQAAALIAETGYHRRDGEVAELAQALGASTE